MVVSGNDSGILQLIQKGIHGLIGPLFRRARFVASVVGDGSSGGGLSLERQTIAGGNRALVALEVVSIDPYIGQIFQHSSFDLIFDLVQNAGGNLAAGASAPDPLDVAFVL